MAAPPHPTIIASGPGKALALVPGGGGQIQPTHVLQNLPQSSVTMVRVVTNTLPPTNPPNGYSASSIGGVEGNSDLRGTAMEICLFCILKAIVTWCTQETSVSVYPQFQRIVNSKR